MCAPTTKTVARADTSQPPMWHLNQFSCFHKAHRCAQQTDRHNDHTTLYVTIEASWLARTAVDVA